MKAFDHINAVTMGIAVCLLLGNTDIASAQCRPGFYCGRGTNFYPQYYPRGYPNYIRPLPPVQPRLPYLNPNAAFRYQKCYQSGPNVSCYPYPAPNYRY